MNSSDGKRLLLEVAGAGDTLGLTSALSGESSEIRAQSMYPCRIASLQRRDFLAFISRHPVAGQNVARELCADLARARERLRILGLTSTATARLALLLLEWCREGQRTAEGIQIRFVLTHREIGECIGASRETVSRTLTDFRVHDLVRMRGSTLVVNSCQNLANYAGIDSTSRPTGTGRIILPRSVGRDSFGCWPGRIRLPIPAAPWTLSPRRFPRPSERQCSAVRRPLRRNTSLLRQRARPHQSPCLYPAALAGIAIS